MTVRVDNARRIVSNVAYKSVVTRVASCSDFCHGMSRTCSEVNGATVCDDCEHNTSGDRCERCMEGFEHISAGERCVAVGLLSSSASGDSGSIVGPVVGAVVGVVAVGAAVYAVYTKRSAEARLKQLRETEQIALIDLGDLAYLSEHDVKGWELPRDRLTLGRKLGAGEFGEVFEGYARNVRGVKTRFKVAVKTLKPGSSERDRNSFLGEASLMRRFKHANVISLIGVCTAEEPVYIVLEYMTHGDLRTYLRSLSGPSSGKSEDKEESQGCAAAGGGGGGGGDCFCVLSFRA